MPDYEKLYYRMFNTVTDLNNRLLGMFIALQQITQELQAAQRDCEDMYISANDLTEAPKETMKDRCGDA